MAANVSKKVFWIFDPSTSTISVDTATSVNATLEARFSFELEIFKDSDTHVESMKITNYKDGNENGSILTSIVDLEKDIKSFKRFGVVIKDSYFRELAIRIEDVYADIRVSQVVLSGNDKRLGDLLDQVKLFVTDSREYITESFCYIPVNMFNGLASDCGYDEYEMKSLRSQLADNGYIYTTSGRYAILKRVLNKPERVIAFYREKLKVEMPVKQVKNRTVKGDGDE